LEKFLLQCTLKKDVYRYLRYQRERERKREREREGEGDYVAMNCRDADSAMNHNVNTELAERFCSAAFRIRD